MQQVGRESLTEMVMFEERTEEGEGEPLHCLEEEKLFPGRESITG